MTFVTYFSTRQANPYKKKKREFKNCPSDEQISELALLLHGSPLTVEPTVSACEVVNAACLSLHKGGSKTLLRGLPV